MSEEAPSEGAADGVAEGKRLLRVGTDQGLSLAERISERFQRLAWRTPLHSLRLRGRHPLKLLAVADDPFLGDSRRGKALMEGRLTYRGEERQVIALGLGRPDFSPGFAEHLHRFAWLRDLSSVTTRAHGAPVAEAIMRQWLQHHADMIADPAWRADLWGWRILYWIAHAPLILSSTDLVYRSTVLHALARGARHSERLADRTRAGVPRIAAWCGILAAGLIIPGGDPRRDFGEAGLLRALESSVFPDGGVAGRTPTAQREAIMLLSMLRATYAARRRTPPDFVGATLTRLVAALLGICHGDRGLSSWQGCLPTSPDEIAALVEGSGVRTRPLRQSDEWGYQRLAARDAVIIMDAAPPPATRVTSGGCASTLAFEFSDGPHRIVVNCGGGAESLQAVPRALRDGLRTTAAHSTLVVGDSNSTAILDDGTLGRGVTEVEVNRQERELTSRIEATHDGYVRRFGFLHRRQIQLASDGRDIRGEDSLIPAGRRRNKGNTAFAIRFHLAPDIDLSTTADGQAVFIRTAGETMWQFRCKGGTLAIEESLWIDSRGRPVPSEQLVVTGEAPAGGASVTWLLRRAR